MPSASDYVRENLAKGEENVARCLWQIKGPKDTEIKLMECWQIKNRMVIIQAFKGMHGSFCVFADIPSVFFHDDKPIMDAMEEKARELQQARM